MCGISGEVHRDPAHPIDQHHVIVIRDRLLHRGPDDAGCVSGGGYALASRRLKIVDLTDRAHMPMVSRDGRYAIVYNGEIHNYRELRRELMRNGHTFQSDSDTEVVLELFKRHGAAILERLNGMWAFAIWDREQRSLFLARDRLGIKPLYFKHAGGSLHFASEQKALLDENTPPELPPDVLEELLCFRFVAGEKTLYRGVEALLPAHYMWWRGGEISTTRWWCLADRARALRGSLPRDAVGWFRDTFDDAVRLRLISDVPVGTLLSGGIDSGAIASSVARQTTTRSSTFTVRFAEKGFDEGETAQYLADVWHLNHNELFVEQADLYERLLEASRLNDEPLVHGNELHLLAISRLAKRDVSVLLSGEGSDEILGGYLRYQPLRFPALIKGGRKVFLGVASQFGFDGRFGKLGRFLELGSIDRFVLLNACDVLPQDLRNLGFKTRETYPFREAMLREATELYPDEPVRQAMYSDQHTFLTSILDRNDRMTMGASIECRVPFLDHRLVEGAAALPSSALFGGRSTKKLLRRAVGERLPPRVLNQPKWGFGVPWNLYLRSIPQLRELVTALPDKPWVEPFDRSLLRSAVQAFLAGNDDHRLLIRQLAMISLWYQNAASGPARAS